MGAQPEGGLTPTGTIASGADRRRVIFATVVGTTIEWYDFFTYAAMSGLAFGVLFFEPAGPEFGRILAFLTVGLIIMVFGWAWGARTIRSMALTLREREFINMAKFSGANTFDILLREVFPYVTAYMLVAFINTVLFAINTEATLAVIGLS